MAAQVKGVSRDSFRLSPWYYWVGVAVGFGTMIVGVFRPELVPYSALGPLGSFLHYINYSQQTLLRLILGSASAVHVGEAVYAYILTRRMNLNFRTTFLWTSQTLILGVSSLLPLKALYRKSL